MTEKISTLDVRQRIGDLLNRVSLRHDEFIIERKGKALAALVPVDLLEEMRAFARARALAAMELQRGAGVSEGEAMALANEGRRWARRRKRPARR